jgi:hypothetical protein
VFPVLSLLDEGYEDRKRPTRPLRLRRAATTPRCAEGDVHTHGRTLKFETPVLCVADFRLSISGLTYTGFA